PGYFTCTQASDYFVMHNHDDGTGVRYDIKLYVTDTGGLEDTAQVLARPEIDLAPSLVATTPDPPQVQSAVVYRFAIRNQGGMPAPVSRWTLSVDGVAIAQGDTAVAARDSVVLAISLPPQFPLGVHTLRLVADTIGQVAEVSEANNATTRPVSFESGPVPTSRGPGSSRSRAPRRTEPSPGCAGPTTSPPSASCATGRHAPWPTRSWPRCPRRRVMRCCSAVSRRTSVITTT
ncbi:MAG: hypothetical protein E6K80_12330, partial [Candidatus Eisenbacteria bacterium]